MEKMTLREAMRARRRALTSEATLRAGLRAAALLAELLLREPGRAPRSALLYSSLPGEADTGAIDALLRRRGAAVAYPRVEGGRLRLHRASPAELQPGQFGIREPPLAAEEISIAALDLVVVPGLAFDRAGHRLGFGGGYYDALLDAAPDALRVGVCLEEQLLPNVPTEPHDQRVDFVLADEIHASGARPWLSPPTPKEVTT